jgi:hypothetical protein
MQNSFVTFAEYQRLICEKQPASGPQRKRIRASIASGRDGPARLGTLGAPRNLLRAGNALA